MVHDRHNYFSFWAIFCSFTPLTAQKNKNFTKMKKKKKPGDIIILHKCIPKIMIICYIVPKIWCVKMQLLFFILAYFLPFYPPDSCHPKNQNFTKMKKLQEISSFYKSVPKITINTVPEM